MLTLAVSTFLFVASCLASLSFFRALDRRLLQRLVEERVQPRPTRTPALSLAPYRSSPPSIIGP